MTISHNSGKAYFFVSGLFVCGIAAYTSFVLTASSAFKSADDLPVQDADVSPTYDTTAPEFDSCVSWSEFLYGINRQRRLLVQQAKGHVLEVSVGTGRNSKFYNLDYTWNDWRENTRYGEMKRRKAAQADLSRANSMQSSASPLLSEAGPAVSHVVSDISPWVEARSKSKGPNLVEAKKHLNEVKSLTFVDLSAPMIEIARKKFESSYPGYDPVQFFSQSALKPLPSSKITDRVQQTGGFDYIVQSMGICSTPEPVQLLQHLGELAKPESGKILLLEHGRGHWDWLNKYLDSTAPVHAKHHGCWYNRDIGKIVEDSGLVVEKCKRKHFGTLWIIEARPKSEAKPGQTHRARSVAEKHPLAQWHHSMSDEKARAQSEPEDGEPGLVSRAWSGLKTITGIAGLKEEDAAHDSVGSKKKP